MEHAVLSGFRMMVISLLDQSSIVAVVVELIMRVVNFRGRIRKFLLTNLMRMPQERYTLVEIYLYEYYKVPILAQHWGIIL